MADKLLALRVFADTDGAMNRSVADVSGGLLLVSQFTLYGSLQKGTRPSFIDAAKADVARPLYDEFVNICMDRAPKNVSVQCGVFGAMMQVDLINDGPVTIILERRHEGTGRRPDSMID
jgi:D-tyrosyl-tRNA(Tyr) deacylase